MSNQGLRVPGLVALAIGLGLVAVPAAAQTDSCSIIAGLQSVSSTDDDGATFVANPRPLEPGTGTFGMAALAAEGEVVAEYAGTIYRSLSGGCQWVPLGRVEISPLRIAPGAGSQAWAWGFFKGREVWRIDTSAIDGNRVVRRANLPASVLTIAVDPFDGDHLRAVGDDGAIYESFDAAASWTRVGRGAPVRPLVYFAAVNRNAMGNVMIGTVLDGVWTTTDDGDSWQQARGLSATAGRVNGFNGVFARADASVAWVMALDLDESQAGHPSGGRHIYRSTNGGLDFEPVVDQGDGITLINGPVLEPHPTDAGVLYFPFGSTFGGGTWLYRYDDATGTTTWNFNTSWVSPRALSIADWAPGTVLAGFEGR